MKLIVELLDNTEIEFESDITIDKFDISHDAGIDQIRSVFSNIMSEKFLTIEDGEHNIRVIPMSSVLNFKFLKNDK